MIIDTVALEKGLKTIYNQAYQMARPPNYAPATTVAPSTSDREKYGWLGALPVMREWIGEKKVKAIADYDYTIINKDWEATIEIDRNELEDDQYDMIRPRIEWMAAGARVFPDRLISDLVINGTSNLAYDGQAFFADRTAPNDNLLAGTGTTDAQVEADLKAARAAMMKFVDDAGEQMGLIMDTIVCPAALEVTFMKFMASTTPPTAAAAGVVNPWQNWLKALIVDYRLTDANDWYGLACGYPLKPFVYQKRREAYMVSLNQPTSETLFWKRKIPVSVEARGNAGYGFFQMAVKTVNT
jgi:phage major head subunit gpT-like protein